MDKTNFIKIRVIKTVDEEKSDPKENLEQIEPIRQINPIGQIFDKIAKICLYFLVFLTPLFFLPLTIAPVEINKQIFAGILALIAFISYLIHSFETKKIAYPRTLTSLAIVLFLSVSGAGVLFSGAKSLSLFGNLSQSDSLVSFLIYGLVFFLAAVFFREENLKWLKLGFFASLFLTTVLGLLSILGKQIGFNTIGSLLSFAIFIAFGLVMILGEIGLKKDEKIEKRKLIALIGLGLLIVFTLILLNYSFIWLALALIVFIFTGYKFITSKINSFLIILISLFLSFGFFSSYLPSLVSLPIEVRPNLSSNWEVIKSAPLKNRLLGSGPATFSQNWSLYRPVELNQTNLWSLRFEQGFSFFATLLSTVGILGFLTVIFLIFAFIREVIRKKEIRAIELGIIFLLFSWLLAPNFFTQSLFIFIGLGLTVALSGSIKEISLATLSRRKIFIFFIVLVALINFSFASLFVVGKKYLAAIYYEKGIKIYNQTGDLKTVLIKLNKVRGLDSSDEYLRTFSQLLLLRINNLIAGGEPSLAPESLRFEIQNTIAYAVDIAKQATLINKNNSLNWSNLANVYERIIPVVSGADSFAEENYKKAIDLDPKNPQELVNLARSLISAADIYGANDANLKRDKLDRAKTYLEESLKLKADYFNARYFLGLIYDRFGDKRAALEQFERIAEFNPNNQEVKKIVENLKAQRPALEGIVL